MTVEFRFQDITPHPLQSDTHLYTINIKRLLHFKTDSALLTL